MQLIIVMSVCFSNCLGRVILPGRTHVLSCFLPLYSWRDKGPIIFPSNLLCLTSFAMWQIPRVPSSSDFVFSVLQKSICFLSDSSTAIRRMQYTIAGWLMANGFADGLAALPLLQTENSVCFICLGWIGGFIFMLLRQEGKERSQQRGGWGVLVSASPRGYCSLSHRAEIQSRVRLWGGSFLLCSTAARGEAGCDCGLLCPFCWEAHGVTWSNRP